jgi:hypothetical protein
MGHSAVDYFSFLFYLLSLISSLHCPTSVGLSRRSVHIIVTYYAAIAYITRYIAIAPRFAYGANILRTKTSYS